MTDDNFYDKVYNLTRQIPAGKVLNYGRVADLLGSPRAARAVGYALNKLAPDSDVPWHRVVGKSGAAGQISLRSFAYSRDEQAERLREEGVPVDENYRFPLIDYLWEP